MKDYINDLSVTEKFLLVSLNSRGKLPVFGIEVSSCFAAAGVLDMCLSGCLAFGEKNRLKAVKPLPENLCFLRGMYEEIERKGNLTIEKITLDYVFSFTGKKLSLYEKAAAESLEKNGAAELTVNKGIFSDKVICIPKEDHKDRIIQEIRAEFLEDGNMTEEMVLLGALMYKSQQIKKYFSRYETDALKKRLKEIKKSREGELVSKAMDYVICVLAAAI